MSKTLEHWITERIPNQTRFTLHSLWLGVLRNISILSTELLDLLARKNPHFSCEWFASIFQKHLMGMLICLPAETEEGASAKLLAMGGFSGWPGCSHKTAARPRASGSSATSYSWRIRNPTCENQECSFEQNKSRKYFAKLTVSSTNYLWECGQHKIGISFAGTLQQNAFNFMRKKQ